MHRFAMNSLKGSNLQIDIFCTDINECQVDPLACAQVCNNTDGGYSCSCFSGYTLAEDGISCNGMLLMN